MKSNAENLLEVEELSSLLDFTSIHLSDQEKIEKLELLSHIQEKIFRNIVEFYNYVADFLPSKKLNMFLQLAENIEQFMVFRNLITAIETKMKNNKKTLNFVGAGFRTVGDKIRATDKSNLSTINDRLEAFMKQGALSMGSGNVLRKVGESFSGIEGTTLNRVIKRTLHQSNPFNKNLKSPRTIHTKSRKMKGCRNDNLLFVVYALNKVFKQNVKGKGETVKPVKLYMEYLSDYGFKDNINMINKKNFFDEMFVEGTSVFIFKEMREKFEDEVSFVDLCFKYMKRFEKYVTFGKTKVKREDLNLEEINSLNKQYFSSDKRTKIEEILDLKKGILRRKIMIDIFKKTYDEMKEDQMKGQGLYFRE